MLVFYAEIMFDALCAIKNGKTKAIKGQSSQPVEFVSLPHQTMIKSNQYQPKWKDKKKSLE
jgi:hypothetical protein